MTTFGIICEFNPFHNGHKRLIDSAFSMGADRVVCVMSGNAVQRGELAIVDKYERAKAAVLCGADLVLELPFPWCAASAEYFASAGIELLSHFCDAIIFGSECGDVELLSLAARQAAEKGFREELRERLGEGERAADTYFSMLEERCGRKLSSNDLLGIEYIRAIIESGYTMKAYTVKRDGADYSEQILTEGENPSATAIRSAWRQGETADEYMPKEAAEVFRHAEKSDIERLSRAVLMYYRLADAEALSLLAELDGGVANRIVTTARESAGISELFDGIKTKRYTDAKLRRALLFGLAQVKTELLRQKPEYTTLLGANEKGRDLLSKIRKNEKIRVVTKPADAPRDCEHFRAAQRLEDIFLLSLPEVRSSGSGYRKGAFIK